MRSLALASLLLCACGSTEAADASVDCLGIPGADMAWRWSVLLHVVDAASRKPVDQPPSFTVGGDMVTFDCWNGGPVGYDLGAADCLGWSCQCGLGTYTMLVSAAGYSTAAVEVDHHALYEGCPIWLPVEKTVPLTHQ